MAYTTLPTQSAGQVASASGWANIVQANFNAMGPHLIVRKTADESVTSSTALQNDDVLLMAVAANEIWQFEFRVIVTGSTTGDLKVAWTFPAGGTISMGGFVKGSSATIYEFGGIVSGTTSPTPTLDIGCDGATVPVLHDFCGVYTNAGTAGNLQFQWAQNTSDGTATTVKAQSTLWAVKLA